jgi:hypothetical protein
LGVDVGKTQDPTAVALAEQIWRPRATEGEGAYEGDASPAFVDHYYIRHLERLELGTDYPEIVRTLAQIWRSVRQRLVDQNVGSGQGKPEVPGLKVYVDATGVGLPVVDMLKEAGVPVIPVYFTHGDRRTEQKDPSGQNYVMLGKAFLVSRMQALLQTNRIHLPKTQEARQLAKELMDYEIKVDTAANDKYGAFKVGTHDDLVTALGLTCVKLVKQSSVPMARGGYVPPRLPSYAQPPQLRPGGFSATPVVHGGLNNWGSDGGNGLDRYGTVDEVTRLLKRREGFTP